MRPRSRCPLVVFIPGGTMRSVRSLRGAFGWALVVGLGCAVSVALGAVLSAPTNLVAQIVGNSVNLAGTPSVAGPVLAYKLEAGSAPGLVNVAPVSLGTSALRVRANQLDTGSGSADFRQAAVARDQRRVERLCQRDIRGLV